MLTSGDFNFSYSGLKTAVLYLIRDIKKENGKEEIDVKTKRVIARAFEDAALDVVIKKTLRAATEYKVKSIIVGGGVAANRRLRELLTSEAGKKLPSCKVLFPERELSTDNSLMIAMAGYFTYLKNNKRGTDYKKLKATGNLKIEQK
jgi:N6-L-threonylcarbamoyladenine synthase